MTFDRCRNMAHPAWDYFGDPRVGLPSEDIPLDSVWKGAADLYPGQLIRGNLETRLAGLYINEDGTTHNFHSFYWMLFVDGEYVSTYFHYPNRLPFRNLRKKLPSNHTWFGTRKSGIKSSKVNGILDEAAIEYPNSLLQSFVLNIPTGVELTESGATSSNGPFFWDLYVNGIFIETRLFDLSSEDINAFLLDLKAKITTEISSVAVLDGKVVIKDNASNNLDGTVFIGKTADQDLDGKIIVEFLPPSASKQLHGKITVVKLGWVEIPTHTETGINRFTITGKLNLDAVVYGVVVPQNSTAPSTEQVLAGRDGAGKKAKGAGSVAATANTTFTLYLSAPNDDPIYDIYVSAQYLDSPMVFEDRLLVAPAGKEFVVVDGIPWDPSETSVLENVDRTLDFVSGGTTPIEPGTIIIGNDSEARALVKSVHLTSGSWAAGTAAGIFVITNQIGTFQEENLTPNFASVLGDSTGSGEGDVIRHDLTSSTGNDTINVNPDGTFSVS